MRGRGTKMALSSSMTGTTAVIIDFDVDFERFRIRAPHLG